MRPCGPASTGNLERLLDLCPGVLFRQRADFSFEYVSPRIEDWSGLSADEWLRGNPLWDLLYEADTAPLQEHLANAATITGEAQITFRIRNRNTGRITYLVESRRPVRTAAGILCGFDGVWIDISVQTLTARQLDAASWEATFGLVTLGAVHDLNNKLTGILSLSDLYLAEIEQAHPLRDGLSTIKHSAQQASQLLHELAALHQGTPGHREYVDLNQVVKVAVDLLRRIVSSRVNIEAVLHNQPLAVTIDRVRLQRLVIAWSLQAAERMPKGGKLKLRTRGVSAAEESPTLAIADTGSALISEPPADQALVVRESVEAVVCDQLGAFARSHAGNFRMDSQPSGTTIEITFPPSRFNDPPPSAGKPWVLLVGKVPQELNALAGELELRSIAPVIASEPLDAQLNPNWFHWDAVLIQSTAVAASALLEPVRRRKLPLKTIVCVAGGDVAELEPWVSSAAELVTPADMSHQRVAEKVAQLFM